MVPALPAAFVLLHPVIIISRAAAFGGDHARADRICRGAGFAEQGAVGRLHAAAQDFAATATGNGFTLGQINFQADFGVKVGEFGADIQAGSGDDADAPPAGSGRCRRVPGLVRRSLDR